MTETISSVAWMIWLTFVIYGAGQVLKSWITTALKVYADRTAAIREGFFQ